MAVHFLFKIKNDAAWNPKTVYYYNGALNEVMPLAHPEEMRLLQEKMMEIYNIDIKIYEWDALIAPVYARLFRFLKPGSGNNEVNIYLDKLKEYVKTFKDKYKDPAWFIAKTSIFIRLEPKKGATVMGGARFGDKFKVLDTVTVCDYHWAKINFKGRECWIAMGDILGDMYGEWIYE